MHAEKEVTVAMQRKHLTMVVVLGWYTLWPPEAPVRDENGKANILSNTPTDPGMGPPVVSVDLLRTQNTEY